MPAFFPSGRPSSPRWRAALWTLAAVSAVMTAVSALLPGPSHQVGWGTPLPNPLAVPALAAVAPFVEPLTTALMGALVATERVTRDHPHVRVLVLSMADDDDAVFAAVRAGARGYVLKGARRAELVRAVRAVAEGEAIFGPALAGRLMGYFSDLGRAPRPSFPELTPREREILGLVAAHLTNGQIAARLGLSQKTVRNAHVGEEARQQDAVHEAAEGARHLGHPGGLGVGEAEPQRQVVEVGHEQAGGGDRAGQADRRADVAGARRAAAQQMGETEDHRDQAGGRPLEQQRAGLHLYGAGAEHGGSVLGARRRGDEGQAEQDGPHQHGRRRDGLPEQIRIFQHLDSYAIRGSAGANRDRVPGRMGRAVRTNRERCPEQPGCDLFGTGPLVTARH
ncbi:LuxR C-terminal-related transcriptional regulator [Microbispora sp. NBC_01389]|uniref:LuxR C-terminal-related transcriptional regulator n=1 Tax=Microbispora sp. NBC_01389 TaxID=2903584 RepID=UPI0032504DC9